MSHAWLFRLRLRPDHVATKLRHGGEPAPPPFFLSKQTFANAIGMSVEDQKAKSRLRPAPKIMRPLNCRWPY